MFHNYCSLLQKLADVHHVEAPQSPQTTPSQPQFKPNAPFSPSTAAPAPPFRAVNYPTHLL